MTPELVDALRWPRCATPTRAIAAAPVTDTIKEAGPDGVVVAHARPLAPVGGPDAAGLPPRRAASARSTRRDDVLARGDRRRLARRARRRARARRRVPAREPQGHDAARPAGRRAALAVLTDYHVHLRPDDDGHRRRALLHGRQRRALPRGGDGARDRRARRRRARPPLHARRSTSGSTRSGASARATTSTPTARFVREETDLRLGHRGRLRPRPRGPHGRACSRRATGTTSSARSTSSATRALDHDGLRRLGRAASRPSEVWRRYFETLGEAARTGLFDILAHPDLVKVWGRDAPAPGGRPAPLLRAGRWRGSPSRGSRSRSPPRGCASRSASIYPARAVPGDVPRRRLPDRALQRRPRARRSSAIGYDEALDAARRRSACTELARLRAPRAAPGADRLMSVRDRASGYDVAPLRAPGRPLDPRRRARSSTSSGSPGHSDADVLDPRGHRRAARRRRRSATSAQHFPDTDARVQGRRLDRAAARRRRALRERRLRDRARRRHA